MSVGVGAAEAVKESTRPMRMPPNEGRNKNISEEVREVQVLLKGSDTDKREAECPK